MLNTVAATSTAAYLAAHPGGLEDQLAGLVHGYTAATAWGAAILAVGAIVVLFLVDARLGAAKAEPTVPAHRTAVEMASNAVRSCEESR